MKKKKVLEIYNDVEKLKVYYPEAFKEEELGEDLEVNNWYWNKEKDTLVFIDNLEKDIYYGFFMGEYNRWSFSKNYNKKGAFKATTQEIEKALINEAKKRGFKLGAKFKNMHIGFHQTVKSKPYFDINTNSLHVHSPRDEWEFANSNPRIFDNGTWATIIKPKQMTQEEIEKELGYKIEIV